MKVINKDGQVEDWQTPTGIGLSKETINKALEFGKRYVVEISDSCKEGKNVHEEFERKLKETLSYDKID